MVQENNSGLVESFRFGNYGEESAQLTLYGDVDHPAAQWECDAAGEIEHPLQACLAECQVAAFNFRGQLRPYGELIKLMDMVFEQIKSMGWQPMPAVEGMPDTGSSVNDLADTVNDPQFWGKDFPAEPQVHGFNVAKGFTVIVHRPGTKPNFSADEVKGLKQLMEDFMQLVFGRVLISSC